MESRTAPELGGDVMINAVRYALARDISEQRPGVAWWQEGGENVQEGDLGEEVTASWSLGWSGGMGETIRLGRDTDGYAFSERMDASQPFFARLAPTRTTITPTNAPGDSPTYFFQETNPTTVTYIYCVQGRRCWKLRVNADNTITNMFEKDFGVGATAGMPTKFEGNWYVPLGATVLFVQLTTLTDTASIDDTWANAAAGMFALHFTTVMDGSIAKMARAASTNRVDLVATAPLVAANWSGGAAGATGSEVGDSSSAITGLFETGVSLFAAKADNLYKFYTPGAAIPIFNIGKGTGDATNGAGLYGIPSMDIALYNHQSGLWAAIGDDIRAIGPDTLPSNQAIPNVTLEPVRGRHYETVVKGNWIYSLYRVTEGGSTRTYITDAKMLRGPLNNIWHTLSFETAAARGMFIDSSNRLWTTNSTQIVYRKLGNDASPDAGRDNIGFGEISTQHRLFLPASPFYRKNGEPVDHTIVQCRSYEVYTRGLGATAPLQLTVYRDGGASENVGATITGNNFQERFWTLGTNDTVQGMVMPVLDITTTAGYAPTTSDPQMWKVKIRGETRPDRGGIIHWIHDTVRPYSNGAQPIENPKQIRDNLQALEGAAPVSVTDPDGASLTLLIKSVSDLRTHITDEGPHYLIDVLAQEFINA